MQNSAGTIFFAHQVEKSDVLLLVKKIVFFHFQLKRKGLKLIDEKSFSYDHMTAFSHKSIKISLVFILYCISLIELFLNNCTTHVLVLTF